jgi:hypothetical protein
VGKAWLPRRTLAGTYDDDWLKNQWPLPPKDFDDAYWNCAPADQQVDYLPPGTEVLLLNLHAPDAPASSETWQGKLPQHQLFVRMRLSDKLQQSVFKDTAMNLDTLVIDMASQTIHATYRFNTAHMDFRGFELGLENMIYGKGLPPHWRDPAS